jgi:hypothetical protein
MNRARGGFHTARPNASCPIAKAIERAGPGTKRHARGDEKRPSLFLILAHERRRSLHVGVTAHPTAEWTAQQLREAFLWTAPRYLLRARDGLFAKMFVDQVREMGMLEVLSTPGSPLQRAYIERVIGTILRECLDHVIVCSERGLRHHLGRFLDCVDRLSATRGLSGWVNQVGIGIPPKSQQREGCLQHSGEFAIDTTRYRK